MGSYFIIEYCTGNNYNNIIDLKVAQYTEKFGVVPNDT